MADSKIIRLLTKLNKLTAEDKLTWQAKSPPAGISGGTDDVIPLYFEAKYKEQWLSIYHHRYQVFNIDYERFFWNERIVLTFLDHEDRPVWQFEEQTPALLNLFEAVRRQAADVDNLLDDLLSDDEDEA